MPPTTTRSTSTTPRRRRSTRACRSDAALLHASASATPPASTASARTAAPRSTRRGRRRAGPRLPAGGDPLHQRRHRERQPRPQGRRLAPPPATDRPPTAPHRHDRDRAPRRPPRRASALEHQGFDVTYVDVRPRRARLGRGGRRRDPSRYLPHLRDVRQQRGRYDPANRRDRRRGARPRHPLPHRRGAGRWPAAAPTSTSSASTCSRSRPTSSTAQRESACSTSGAARRSSSSSRRRSGERPPRRHRERRRCIVGLAIALAQADRLRDADYAAHCAALRDHLLAGIPDAIPDVQSTARSIRRCASQQPQRSPSPASRARRSCSAWTWGSPPRPAPPAPPATPSPATCCARWACPTSSPRQPPLYPRPRQHRRPNRRGGRCPGRDGDPRARAGGSGLR